MVSSKGAIITVVIHMWFGLLGRESIAYKFRLFRGRDALGVDRNLVVTIGHDHQVLDVARVVGILRG